MISKLHERLGTAGFVIAIVALVAALGGTAFAAASLNGKQKKEVENIAKKVAKTGPQGPAGSAGPAGPAGAKGDKGDTGAQGATGGSGANGKSVSLGTASGSECPQGGTTVEVEGTPTSKKKVCNGQAGSPWTAGGTLPAGATETGAWTLGPAPEGTVTFGSYAALSFSIPLETELALAQVHFINLAGKEMPGEVTQTACLGTVDDPTAEPENLCVYQGKLFTASFLRIDKLGGVEEKGASTAGAKLVIKLNEEEASAWGTYAVAGPEA